MKVWICFEHYEEEYANESHDIVEVFDSKEKAEEWKKNNPDKDFDDMHDDIHIWYTYEEREVH